MLARDLHRGTVHGERIAKGHPDAVRDDLRRIGVVPDQNRELVAADASERVTFLSDTASVARPSHKAARRLRRARTGR